MPTVVCPHCGQRLSLAQIARVVVCPNCLRDFDLGQVSRAGTVPIPVIPVEDQVHRDTKGTKVFIIAVPILCVVGIVLIYQIAISSVADMIIFTLGGAIIAAFLVFGFLTPNNASSSTAIADVPQTQGPGSPGILPYARPPRHYREPRARNPFTNQIAAGFIAGSIALALVCGGAAQTRAGSIGIPAVLGLLTLLSLFSSRTRGFAVRVLIFVGLGITAVYAICGK